MLCALRLNESFWAPKRLLPSERVSFRFPCFADAPLGCIHSPASRFPPDIPAPARRRAQGTGAADEHCVLHVCRRPLYLWLCCMWKGCCNMRLCSRGAGSPATSRQQPERAGGGERVPDAQAHLLSSSQVLLPVTKSASSGTQASAATPLNLHRRQRPPGLAGRRFGFSGQLLLAQQTLVLSSQQYPSLVRTPGQLQPCRPSEVAWNPLMPPA